MGEQLATVLSVAGVLFVLAALFAAMLLLHKPVYRLLRRWISGPPNDDPALDELASRALDHIQTKMRRQEELEEAKHQARLAKARRGELDEEEPRF